MQAIALDKIAVQLTAQKQIDQEGYTTTLDVKNELRAAGYWATQDAVSQIMDELANEGVYHWEDSGQGFRIYNTPITPQNQAIANLITAVNAQPKPVKDYTYQDCDVVDPDPTVDACCMWECTCYSDKQAPVKLVISSKPVDRNTARQAYSAMLNRPYRDVKAVQYG